MPIALVGIIALVIVLVLVGRAFWEDRVVEPRPSADLIEVSGKACPASPWREVDGRQTAEIKLARRVTIELPNRLAPFRSLFVILG